MKKAEFVEKIAEKGNITKKKAEEDLALIFSTIQEILVAGNELAVPKFGKFSVIIKKARKGINPQTKKKIKIPKTKAVKFTASQVLKDSVKK